MHPFPADDLRLMRFHFHIVSAGTAYFDSHGVECDSPRAAIEQARAAIAEWKAEENWDLSVDGSLVITSSGPYIVVAVLPLDEFDDGE